MKRPSDLSGQFSSSPPQTLKILSILLLGIGLGALGTMGLTAWLTAKADSASSAAGKLPSPLRFSQNDASPSSGTSAGDVSSATVCVKTRKGWNELACASGVSIDPQLAGVNPTQGAVVLTNYHVIADMGNRPPLQLGGQGKVFNAEIIRQSPEFDLALLLVPQTAFPIAALADASPGQGTAVRAIGFPNDQPLTIKDSSLKGTTQICLAVSPCLALQQGTITFGNSGGPLEANGQVIGITQGEIEDEVAIPVEQIRQFLSGQVPPASSRSQFAPGFPPQGPMRGPMREAYPYPYPHPMEAPPYPAW
jgi:S1-C subfamily serine protease